MTKSKTKKLLAALAVLCAVGVGSCVIPVPATFPGGIRIRTTEELIGLPGTRTPVPNCGYAGVMNSILGPGPGTDQAITGRTGPAGVADNPNARVNASWTVSVSFPIPQCVFPPATRNVPTNGAQFHFACVL